MAVKAPAVDSRTVEGSNTEDHRTDRDRCQFVCKESAPMSMPMAADGDNHTSVSPIMVMLPSVLWCTLVCTLR